MALAVFEEAVCISEPLLPCGVDGGSVALASLLALNLGVALGIGGHLI